MPNTRTSQNTNIAQSARSNTTAPSSSSGNGSDPLSEAFVAVQAERSEGGGGPGSRVKAPQGAVHLEVRRSSRLTTSSSRHASQQPATKSKFIKAPPGVKPATGYEYEVLSPLQEGSGDLADQLAGSSGERVVLDSLRDVGTTHASPKAPVARSSGRKRAATSEPQDSSRRHRNPSHLASAADFPDDHWIEPNSEGENALLGPWGGEAPAGAPDNRVPAGSESRRQPDSPMQTVPSTPVQGGIANPESSPITHNPLLQKEPQTPGRSPSKCNTVTFRTNDPDTAWMMAEGLAPIGDGFHAPGFLRSNIVGGVTYNVTSPKAPSPSRARKAPHIVTKAPPLSRADHTASPSRAAHTPYKGKAPRTFTTHGPLPVPITSIPTHLYSSTMHTSIAPAQSPRHGFSQADAPRTVQFSDDQPGSGEYSTDSNARHDDLTNKYIQTHELLPWGTASCRRQTSKRL